MSATGPHAGQPVLQLGPPLADARAAVVLIHGRGASADDILLLGEQIEAGRPGRAGRGISYLAPQAAGNVWYPQRFMEPLASNEPWLSSALSVVGAVLAEVGQHVPPEKTVLLGFSQGACLATEYAARNARRYGGVVGLSGGLIGPPGTRWDFPAGLDGTPVFLGCSDVDSHIPKERVQESAEVLRRLGGDVTARLYPGMGHTVNEDELAWVRQLLDTLA